MNFVGLLRVSNSQQQLVDLSHIHHQKGGSARIHTAHPHDLHLLLISDERDQAFSQHFPLEHRGHSYHKNIHNRDDRVARSQKT
jgi:hypothetical protein